MTKNVINNSESLWPENLFCVKESMYGNIKFESRVDRERD